MKYPATMCKGTQLIIDNCQWTFVNGKWQDDEKKSPGETGFFRFTPFRRIPFPRNDNDQSVFGEMVNTVDWAFLKG